MNYSKEIIEFHRYTPGCPEDPELGRLVERYSNFITKLEKDPTKHSGGPARLKVDLAWLVLLRQAGLLTADNAAVLLRANRALQSNKLAAVQTRSHGFAERSLIAAVGGDEDLGSIVNLGRTLQEPMSRIDLRDKMLEVFDELLALQDAVLQVAAGNIDTIMPGYTHLSQAQPITLAHYLLSVFDGLARGYDQLSLAYRDTNRNSGGCGACSGITWPIDRWEMTRLLGFDDLVEPTYDSESAQDHSLSILFALTNITLLLSKVTMDWNIWGMEEVGMIEVDPAWCGVSSMMPQKCIPGSQLERARLEASYVVGQMMAGVSFCKGEPHADMLPMLEVPKVAIVAMARSLLCMGYFRGILTHMEPQREAMLGYVRAGFSCASEVAAHLVKEGGYGTRRAHRIVATMVRLARERRLKAFETTGELLDEAAEFAGERKPGLDTQTLRRLLDPEHFVRTHINTGGVAPAEAKRMLEARSARLEQARAGQAQRHQKIHDADAYLDAAIERIFAEVEKTA